MIIYDRSIEEPHHSGKVKQQNSIEQFLARNANFNISHVPPYGRELKPPLHPDASLSYNRSSSPTVTVLDNE